MKIIDANTGKHLLEDIDNLYCSSSNTSFDHPFSNIEGRLGQVLLSEMPKIKPRTFSITGTIETNNYNAVDRERSKIVNALIGKKLRLFLEDDDDIYYNCVLNGAVNVTYYAGHSISRVFSIFFNLICYEGVGWGEKASFVSLHSGVNDVVENFNLGNIFFSSVVIRIKKNANVAGAGGIKASLSEPLIDFLYIEEKREVHRGVFLKKEVNITDFPDGLVLLNLENQDEMESVFPFLDIKTLIKPPIIIPTISKISINTKAFSNQSKDAFITSIDLHPCYL